MTRRIAMVAAVVLALSLWSAPPGSAREEPKTRVLQSVELPPGVWTCTAKTINNERSIWPDNFVEISDDSGPLLRMLDVEAELGKIVRSGPFTATGTVVATLHYFDGQSLDRLRLCPDPVPVKPTPTPEPSATTEPTVEPTATVAPTATVEPTAEPTVTATATVEPTVAVTATVTPTATADVTPTPEATIEPTVTADPTATVAPTSTVEPTTAPTSTVVPTTAPTLTPTAVAPTATPIPCTNNPSAPRDEHGRPICGPRLPYPGPFSTPTPYPTVTPTPTAVPVVVSGSGGELAYTATSSTDVALWALVVLMIGAGLVFAQRRLDEDEVCK